MTTANILGNLFPEPGSIPENTASTARPSSVNTWSMAY
jgi:hypothetical protein